MRYKLLPVCLFIHHHLGWPLCQVQVYYTLGDQYLPPEWTALVRSILNMDANDFTRWSRSKIMLISGLPSIAKAPFPLSLMLINFWKDGKPSFAQAMTKVGTSYSIHHVVEPWTCYFPTDEAN